MEEQKQEINIPEEVKKEYPDFTPENWSEIVNSIKLEELGIRIGEAKKKIMQANKISMPDAKKALLDYKNLFRQLSRKQEQLTTEIVEKDSGMIDNVKPRWKILAEIDLIEFNMKQLEEELRIANVDIETTLQELTSEKGE